MVPAMPPESMMPRRSHGTVVRPARFEGEETVMTRTLHKGDKVEWDSSGGHSTGKVVKKLTSTTHIKGHKVAATRDNPEYLVESSTGKRAAHKPGALTRA
jgi:hypothetical protein